MAPAAGLDLNLSKVSSVLDRGDRISPLGHRVHMHFSAEEGMSVFRFVNAAVRRASAIALVGLLATASFAQEGAKPSTPAPVPTSNALVPMPQAPAPQHNAHPYSDQDFTRGQSQLPKFWSVWTVRSVAPPNFTNSSLIDRVMRDGKMYLSLDDAVALALENNLDIAIQRYNLVTADIDILRTSSGSTSLGVNTGLVQGTPGTPPDPTDRSPAIRGRGEPPSEAEPTGPGGCCVRPVLPQPPRPRHAAP